MRQHVLVAYDIADDKRLRRVMRTCLDYGDRVQFSVYAVQVSDKDLAILKERLHRQIAPTQDRVMFVRLGPVAQEGEPPHRIDTIGLPIELTDRKRLLF
ncbi:MAG: CRISPR-associated endonuclease Cas2 [Deltaproteobacteria bacterium]|nr:CRISPR-associated endonuclease Cas2 [Deltaproteobacteria bacterium]